MYESGKKQIFCSSFYRVLDCESVGIREKYMS